MDLKKFVKLLFCSIDIVIVIWYCFCMEYKSYFEMTEEEIDEAMRFIQSFCEECDRPLNIRRIVSYSMKASFRVNTSKMNNAIAYGKAGGYLGDHTKKGKRKSQGADRIESGKGKAESRD